MNELTAYKAAQIEPAQEITVQLFNDFVRWIDRTQATTRAYLTNLKQFMAWMRQTGIKQPTRDDILSYRQYLIDKELKANTITAYLRSVKQFFSWTAANGLYPDVAANIHAPKVDHSTHKKDALTVQEALAVEKSIEIRATEKIKAAELAIKDNAGRIQRSTEQGKRLYAMYLLTVNAGLRTIEISRANIKDLETRDGQTWLYIWGKGRSEADQKKAIAPEVMSAIQDYLKARTDKPTGTSPLFVSTGNRSGGKRIATTTISTMLKKAMQEAGFNSERLTAHSLRHTAGTAIYELTKDLYQTQNYMRHSSPVTTETYIHDIEKTKNDAHAAQRLYSFCHEKEDAMQLQDILKTLKPEQLQQLTTIALNMAS